MADKKIAEIPQPLEYRVLVAGFMFNEHCAVGKTLRLYPEQATNYLPPFGKNLILAEDYVEPEDDEKLDGAGGDSTGKTDGGDGDGEVLSKLKKDELLTKLDDINAILDDEHKIDFNENMTKAELIDLIGSE